ncbi:hypothetical protein H6F67_19790 [Microcoleus sp. FACHB-1515]|uniref:hypothetical protein n=1 Tax=Cyanophyceae TaxID=3028117 RepID=UPI001684AE05|nr:hypothetical protein [Microcoleus sp. FACHB-1515]MBD2092094.1 hypothetical protein [Microcoleus sp. FACHB-1515]
MFIEVVKFVQVKLNCAVETTQIDRTSGVEEANHQTANADQITDSDRLNEQTFAAQSAELDHSKKQPK